MNDELLGRLHNWKFRSALKYLNDEPENIRAIITSLAEEYGNIGWICGDAKIKTQIEERLSTIEEYEPPSFMGYGI